MGIKGNYIGSKNGRKESMKTLEKINVKDITTHSQADKERDPRIIELKVCGIAFRVHRYIHIPGTWFLSCYEFGINKEDMNTDDLKEAIHKARAFMVGYLDAKIIRMQKASKILQESEEIEI